MIPLRVRRWYLHLRRRAGFPTAVLPTEARRCDGPGCEAWAPRGVPAGGWSQLTRMAVLVDPDRRDTWQFHSFDCLERWVASCPGAADREAS